MQCVDTSQHYEKTIEVYTRYGKFEKYSMTIWHVGDTHFGHRTVAKFRGFFTPNGETDVTAHDDAVYASIADVLEPGDTLRLYGDLSMDGDWRYALRLLLQLKSERPRTRFELLYGNHDVIHPLQKKKPLEVYEEYATVFDWMGERLYNTSDYGRRVHFSHFPAVNGDDRHSDKFRVWQIPETVLNLTNDPAHEDWVVHGHTHQTTFYNETRPNHLCVSWDVFRGPVSDDVLKRGILRQLGKRQLLTPAHWGEWEQYKDIVASLDRS